MKLTVAHFLIFSISSILANEGGFGPWIDFEHEPRGSWTTVDDLDMLKEAFKDQATNSSFGLRNGWASPSPLIWVTS